MVKSIILTSKNLVADGVYNDTYRYVFPAGQVQFKNHGIAVASISIYNSFYNISSALGNNTYSYIWPSAVPETVSVTIPDGQYTITELNTFLQFTFIQHTHYLVDGSGNLVYFYEILNNPTANKVELISYPLPSVLGTYTQPVGATWGLPASPTTPQLTLTQTISIANDGTGRLVYGGLATLLGFNSAGTNTAVGSYTQSYPDPAQASTYNVLADTTDQVYSINGISLACSLLENNLSVPQSLLYSFPINESGFGDVIVDKQGSFAFVPIVDVITPDIVIRFYDQNGDRLRVRDTDVVIYLLIKPRDES